MASLFSSVKLTIILLSALAVFVLLGAWCPQISQSGEDKVVEQFGQQTADILIKAGVADIFHSPAFLFLIALLTINIIMGSCKHVFPKLKLLRLPMPKLQPTQISKLPTNKTIVVKQSMPACTDLLLGWLRKKGYRAHIEGKYLTAEAGKYGRLAPTITHIGLLSLLLGLTISSWTGFSGFAPAVPGESFSLSDAQHSHLWIGSLPAWRVKVNDTRREDYATGEVKQWYSNLSVTDSKNNVLKNQIISVNDPLQYQGVDIYQSSWSLKTLKLRFNGKREQLNLQPMGKIFAAFLPLPDQAVIIFSVRDQYAPLRVFAKRKDWEAPKLLSELLPNQSINLGDVAVTYDGVIPQTGLQYKSDPGFPIVFFAFVLITAGVSLAAVPHRQIWAYLDKQTISSEGDVFVITIGGSTKKGKQSLSKQIESLAEDINKLGNYQRDNNALSDRKTLFKVIDEPQTSGGNSLLNAKNV